MLWSVRKSLSAVATLARRARYHLSFPRLPDPGGYCNSKSIALRASPAGSGRRREYLVFIRCGASHGLSGADQERNFDIALNPYSSPDTAGRDACDYLIAGGVNKYKAAYQFIDAELLDRYQGFMFLDDDLEISASTLSDFLRYCSEHGLQLAQPSLTADSHTSHDHVRNAAHSGWRPVAMIEVMCPFFSARALRQVLPSFDLSYSTWGLDYLWPRLLDVSPAVVDAFTIRHTRPVHPGGDFYRYMKHIGIQPQRELEKIQNMPLNRL